jgi:retinol dehydrogenase 12
MLQCGQSKLALIYLGRELALEYPKIKAVSIHPRRAITGIAHKLREESLLHRVVAPLSPIVCATVVVGLKETH